MKKLLIILGVTLLAVPLVVGILLGFAHKNTTADTIPQPPILVNSRLVEPDGYEWKEPVFSGVMFKDFFKTAGPDIQYMENNDGNIPQLELPAGFEACATLYSGQIEQTNKQHETGVCSFFIENKLFEGEQSAQIPDDALNKPGNYLIEIRLILAKHGNKGHGELLYRVAVEVQLTPKVEQSALQVQQGDVLAIEVNNLPQGIVPTAETDIALVMFTPSKEGTMSAYVPVSYYCDIGEYSIPVKAGSEEFIVSFTVTPKDFPRQDLEMDFGDPVISQANSPEAYQQYRDTIYPLYDSAHPERYWSGYFLKPCDGPVSTEYGMRRYTNGVAVYPHSGIDIAAPEGTQVVAPNGGKVVLAEYLLNTGYTLVIEHGGGMKSYFYHLSELEVETGDFVQRGDYVGKVGSTGYSTGPHLHYEILIGNQSIDPILIFEGKSGLLFFE